MTKQQKAEEIKNRMMTTDVQKWGFGINVWESTDGKIVRVYINDKKRKTQAFAQVNDDLTVTVTGLPGGSMSRNQLTKVCA